MRGKSITVSNLKDKTILFSGVFEGHDRVELERTAERAGAKLLSGVTKNLNYLLAREKMGPAKREKSAELGVPVITLAKFLKMVGPLKKEKRKPIDYKKIFAEAKANLPDVDLPSNPSTLAANKKNIISALGMPLPPDVEDFYRQFDGFYYGTFAEYVFDEEINSLARLFDDFKPLQKMGNNYLDDALYEADPFFDVMWDPWNGPDINTKEGRKELEKMRRQKMLIYLNGHSDCLTIEFTKTAYKLYLFDLKNGMFELNMTFPELIRGLAHLGCANHWMSIYIKGERKWYSDITWDTVEETVPGFRREMLGVKRSKKEAARYNCWQGPILLK